MTCSAELAPIAVRYGPHPGQEAELRLPDADSPPVVCLLHGGFWRMPHGKDQMDAIGTDLVEAGWAVWNIEYRRLGAVGGGWPATLTDVAAAIDHLADLRMSGLALDLTRVITVGHSAGGQLALHAAARRGGRVRVAAAAGLAPIADLALGHAARLGNDAVAELMGGAPDEVPEGYAHASPAALLPLGVPQLIVHGTADQAVPVELSRHYVEAARGSGDLVEFVELPDTGHMAFLDPASAAHAPLRRWLRAVLRR